MIFIKNYAKNLESKDVNLVLTEENKTVELALDVKGERVSIVLSKLEGVGTSIKRSLEIVGKTINYIKKDETTCTTHILDNKATEISFFVKGMKTVLKNTESLPNEIDYLEEGVQQEVHYPRDMVVMIVPNIMERGEVRHQLVVDRRNLGARTIYHPICDHEYTVIFMYVKFPIWAKFKFPAYAYINSTYKLLSDESEQIAAFKLSSMVNNKNINKNKVVDVDIKEAKDYLDESFRILRDKSAERKESTKQKQSDFKNNRSNRNNNQGYQARNNIKCTGGFNNNDSKNRNRKNYR